MEEVLSDVVRAVATEVTAPSVSRRRLGGFAWRGPSQSPWLYTVLIIGLAAALRTLVIVRAHGMMDFDEAVLGIQAERILHGAHPIYFAGQAYMGAWDAYLAAPLIAIFGPSAAVLHTITLVESLLLVPLMGAVAVRLYGPAARVPAMILAAVPPLFATTVELRMLGGYVETLVLGSALLLLALTIADRWRAGQPTTRVWIAAAFLLGLGCWIDQLIAYYVVTVVIWLGPLAFSWARRTWSAGDGKLARLRPAASTLALAAVAFCLGSLPMLVYLARHGVNNITYIENQSVFGASNQSYLRLGALDYYRLQAAPNVMGARIPVTWIVSHKVRLGIELVVTTLSLAAALYALARCVRLGLKKSAPEGGSRSPGALTAWREALPVILIVVITVIFWVSPTTSMLRGTTWIDAASRYAVPLTTALTLTLTQLYLHAPRLLGPLSKWTARSRSASVLARVAPLLVALCLLGVYLLPYVAGNVVAAMQSPYAPGRMWPSTNASGVVAYIQRAHIQNMWADLGYGNIIMYLDENHVACADYDAVAVRQEANRFPDVYARVVASDRPSFLVVWDPSRGSPPIEAALSMLKVQYTAAHFGDIWIVTPISRTVRPAEIASSLT